MSKPVSEIEGIGPAMAEKLAKANIKTVEGLLDKCGSAKGRKEVAELSGIDAKKLLDFANMADLFRINGVGKQFAELLKAAGVDTVKELGTRKPENLHAKLVEVNEQKKLAKSVPALSRVQAFVEEAKTMDAMVTH
ncbi:protein of unknown function [Catalinimonas alkaloidigena]|uniref:Helix-hairpin-helix DNA-binding motif class 1 domain-containing protein n=1 Tax=Catalinimonas alkaloidigena TaxID=1075417 RepID=A0A1G9T2Q7_9BACT|nr:DUF4332 domain-containing protein [Catalinimonas alkaloidigena]SDM41365.1 protein of unknown function [Catalinimonas alkaloidigena]